MCIEDIRLQRKTGSYQTTANVTTTGNVLLEADPKRTAIVISTPQALTGLTIAFDTIPQPGGGIRILGGQNSFTLSLLEHGNIVTRKLCACLDAASAAETIPMLVSRLEVE